MAANKTNNSKTLKEDAIEYLVSLLVELPIATRQEAVEFLGDLLMRLQDEGQSKSRSVTLDPPQGSVISSADDDFDDDDDEEEEEELYDLEEPEMKVQTLSSADDDLDEEFDLEDNYDD